MLTRLHLQSSKPLYIINEVRRPIDVRIQSQLSQLRDRISTTETALRELHAYRDSIPDGPYHSQVMDYEKQIDQANEMIGRLLKLEAHTRRSQTYDPLMLLSAAAHTILQS